MKSYYQMIKLLVPLHIRHLTLVNKFVALSSNIGSASFSSGDKEKGNIW